jgi:hypothetical protein
MLSLSLPQTVDWVFGNRVTRQLMRSPSPLLHWIAVKGAALAHSTYFATDNSTRSKIKFVISTTLLPLRDKNEPMIPLDMTQNAK